MLKALMSACAFRVGDGSRRLGSEREGRVL